MDPDRHPSPLCMQCIGDPEHHKNPECQWYGGPWLPTQEELDEAPQIKYPPDLGRISPILDALNEAWRTNPELRLGQLISNLADSGGTADTYYVTDDVLLEALRRWNKPEPREWEIWVCPTCGGLPMHLGDGVQGCGRHRGTTYHRGAGVSRTSDIGPSFVQVKVAEVID